MISYCVSRSRFSVAAVAAILLISSLMLPAFTAATMQAKKPITKQGLIKALKLNALSTQELVEQIQSRGVEFQLSASDEAELRAAGARPEIISTARSSFRGAGPAPDVTTATNSSTARPPANVPSGPSLSKNEIITLLQSGVAATRVEQFVEARGVNFVSTPAIAREIMSAGGNRSLIGAISEKAEVAAATTSTSSGNPSPANNSENSGAPDYDDLTDKATDAMQAENASGAIRFLQQAIQVDQSKPTAYALLGVAQLYGKRNLGAATAPMRSAIERGGAATFRVYHDHDGAFTKYCEGSFFVTKTGVSFKADDGNDTFESEDTNIKEAKLNALMGVNYGAFHVKLTKEAGGRNYNFAPATRQREESQLITTLVQGY